MPVDIQSMPVDKAKSSKRNIADHVSSLMARGGQLPDRTQLERAAAILNQAEKPFILVGQGALGAGQELLEMAEKLGAPIGKALLGQGAVPELSDYSTAIGRASCRERRGREG